MEDLFTSYEGKVILTGDRPTGPLHLGHFVGSLKARVSLQERNNQFVMIADMQGLTDHAENPQVLRTYVREVVLDYLSVGIDPEKTTLFLQSKIAALSELTLFYLNLVTWNRLKHNPTVKAEILQKGFKESVPAGFMIYPISQAADITAFKAELVPVGEDQIPMIEQTIELVRKFSQTYSKGVLVEPKALLSSSKRLAGTDGKPKMSKTTGNAIFLSDEIDLVAKKVKKMYTDPTHLKVEDPGKVEGNPVFDYLDAFDSNKKEVSRLKEHYQRGGLADSKVKGYLLEILEAFLSPIRKKRKEYEKDPTYIAKIIREGSNKASSVAEKTLSEVKEAIGIWK